MLKRKFLKEKYAGNDCSVNNRWARIAQSVVCPAVLFPFSIKDNPPGAVWEKNLSNLWAQLGYLRDGEELSYIKAVTLRLPPSLNSETGWTV